MDFNTSKTQKAGPAQMGIKRPEQAAVPSIKSSIPLALAEGPAGEVSSVRMHNGLPVITEEEYRRGYNTQSSDAEVRIFDFTGYIERPDGSLLFRDVTALNGLRGGIHVGIDGTMDYWDSFGQVHGMEDIGEYVIYTIVPSETQKKEGVMVSCDSCYNVEEYQRTRAKPGEGPLEEIALAQSDAGYIVTRLNTDPQKPGARDGIRVLSLAISEYIRGGYPLDRLKDFIYAAEERILAAGGSGKVPTLEDLCPR